MEPTHRFIQLYRRMRLVIYRRLLRRTGQLSTADAFAADIIYLLEQPTLTQVRRGNGHFTAQRQLPGE